MTQGPVILARVGASPADRDSAIREAGQLLVAAGCVSPGYVEGMLHREAMADTFLGAGVAIPHGRLEDKALVRRDGIAVLQIPHGVNWGNGALVRLVIGMAAASDSHMAVLRRLTRLMGDARRLEALCAATDPGLIEASLGEISPCECAVQSCAPSLMPSSGMPCEGDQTVRLETVRVVLPYAEGLHARPASVWTAEARTLGVPLCVRHANGSADPRDLVSLLALGIRAGDPLDISVDIAAHGPRAALALERFCRVITALDDDETPSGGPASPARTSAVENSQGWMPPDQPLASAIPGVAASPGLAVGVLHRLHTAALHIPDTPVSLLDGGALLEAALERTRRLMQALADDAARRLGAEDAAIFRAQTTMLDDTRLITLACRHMVAGHGPAWAWNASVEEVADGLAGLSNPQLAGRAADLRDIGNRVLLQLEPELARTTGTDPLPEVPCILVADDLSPSDTVGLVNGQSPGADVDGQSPGADVVGLVTAQGGPTSHTAILARTLGIPAVVAAQGVLPALNERHEQDRMAIVDGDHGRVWLDVSEEAAASARAWIHARRLRRAEEISRRGLPAVTTDGHTLTVLANVNRPDQVPSALEHGAEGVGLMRTEFLFLERGLPDEHEQYAVYSAMAAALGRRPLIVRALDIGGDKQAARLCLPRESNPFLGVRGSRLLLRRGDLFEPQMRALYRLAREGAPLSVMFSMITSLREVLELREGCERIREALHAPRIPLGIMIEVPAAAIMARSLAAHVDFFSIGTNDLTQYTLAMDRQNPALAAEVDSLHPAVLRLVRMTVDGAADSARPVGVCGGLAGDPFGAALLAGMGVRELSMTPRDIPAVKAVLRRHSLAALHALAEQALTCESASDIRALADACLKDEQKNEPGGGQENRQGNGA